jgi:predicted RNA-binding Zn-ribbon protein involved in translation (DUF1610 family)
MRIKSITSQSRRDFYAIYECEHCGAEHKGSGYDDDNFHRNVIPQMKCPQCGKVASDDFRPMSTKYPEHAIL